MAGYRVARKGDYWLVINSLGIAIHYTNSERSARKVVRDMKHAERRASRNRKRRRRR